MNVIYVAVPYSHKNDATRNLRFEMVTEFTARLYRAGLNAYSPITHTHPLAKYGLPETTDFWLGFDFEFLRSCKQLWVLSLAGWEKSEGVSKEIEFAETNALPVFKVDYDTPVFDLCQLHNEYKDMMEKYALHKK